MGVLVFGENLCYFLSRNKKGMLNKYVMFLDLEKERNRVMEVK